jgi:hypothetical protein
MPLSAGDKLGALPEAIGLLTICGYGTKAGHSRNLFAKRFDQNERSWESATTTRFARLRRYSTDPGPFHKGIQGL